MFTEQQMDSIIDHLKSGLTKAEKLKLREELEQDQNYLEQAITSATEQTLVENKIREASTYNRQINRFTANSVFLKTVGIAASLLFIIWISTSDKIHPEYNQESTLVAQCCSVYSHEMYMMQHPIYD